MRNRFVFVAVFAGIIMPGAVLPAVEERWRSELYPEEWAPPGLEWDFYTNKFLQDYSYAGYRLGEPIPDIPAPVFGRRLFDVTEPPYHADPSGQEDSTAAIQSAINDAAAAGRGVVFLPEGTYRVSTDASGRALRIESPEIILRGAGVDRTFILNTTWNRRQQRIIGVRGPAGSWRSDDGPAVPIVRDLMGPTRVLPVEETGPFDVGDWVVVRTNTTVEWVDEHKEPDWREHVGSSQLNGFAYYRQVVAIDHEAKTLLIDIPTRYALKIRDAARVHPARPLLTEVGLEDFSIGNLEHPGVEASQWSSESYSRWGHHAYEIHGSAAISFERVRDSWVRNVHSFRPEENSRNTHILSNGVIVSASRSLTLENVRMARPLYGGGGGNGYMFRLSSSSDILIRECEAAYSRHGFVFSSMSSTGNVIHHSLDQFTNRQAAGTGMAGGANSDHHMFFSHSNLIDQSRVRDSMFEARYRPYTSSPQHNITSAHSAFWNIIGIGEGEHSVRSEQARYGYVIGTSGLDGSSKFGVLLDNVNRPQTAPADHVEGVGDGATLVPASLYLDQLNRRRSSIRLDVLRSRGAALPSNSGSVAVHAMIGADLDLEPDELQYAWTKVSGPGEVRFSNPGAPETRVLMERPGVYRIRVTVTGDARAADVETELVFEAVGTADGQRYEEWATAGGLPEEERRPEADPHGRGIPNLIVYATGVSRLDPRGMFVRKHADGGGLQVVVPWRRRLADAAWFLLEESADLVEWIPVDGLEWEVLDLDSERLLFQTNLPIVPSIDSRFIRIHFSLEARQRLGSEAKAGGM